MFQKKTISTKKIALFFSISIFTSVNTIHAFITAKKNPKTVVLHQKQESTSIETTETTQYLNNHNKEKPTQRQETSNQSLSIQNLNEQDQELPTILNKTTVAPTSTEEPEQKSTPDERKAKFEKEFSDLLVEYKNQLAQIETLKTNQEFLKLSTPLYQQQKEISIQINQLICQFIPEMTTFYQQLQILLTKHQQEN